MPGQAQLVCHNPVAVAQPHVQRKQACAGSGCGQDFRHVTIDCYFVRLITKSDGRMYNILVVRHQGIDRGTFFFQKTVEAVQNNIRSREILLVDGPGVKFVSVSGWRWKSAVLPNSTTSTGSGSHAVLK